ncbi:BrnT family toxin [Paraburkholderia sp. MM6662-R1]|uniref:BrnT family toxin n=1 Tax=Paraburkholderia sp. MM6662-R1 TaxID=2991066 RepID=UPI003D2532DD
MFSWDDIKNEKNRRKHGVSFELAQFVFDDPFHVTQQDRIENGEQRWQTIGTVEGVVLLLVAHTWTHADDGDEHIRIVSARRATRLERKIYEEGT